jgi:hypothetical protein
MTNLPAPEVAKLKQALHDLAKPLRRVIAPGVAIKEVRFNAPDSLTVRRYLAWQNEQIVDDLAPEVTKGFTFKGIPVVFDAERTEVVTEAAA